MTTENKMRNIQVSEALITKTFGVDHDKVLFNTFNITDKHLTFSLEWTDTGNIMQATITKDAVKPKFTLSYEDNEFVQEQLKCLFYMKDELFTEDEKKVNDQIFENQEYDPARGYVDKDNEQQVEVDFAQEVAAEDSSTEQ